MKHKTVLLTFLSVAAIAIGCNKDQTTSQKLDEVQEKTKEVFQRIVKGESKDPYQSKLMKFSPQELAALHQLGVQEGISYGLSGKEASNVMSHLTQRIAAIQQN